LAGATIPSTAGIELGGNGSLLISDPTLNVFGLGAGYQGSVFLTMWTDHPICAKMRLENISMNEESVQKSQTNYIIPSSTLQSMSQNWTILSFGAQGNFPSQGQTFYWEALLGYAFGGQGSADVQLTTPGTGVINTTQSTSSGFMISGGAGIKRVFSPKITGLFGVRTMLLLAPAYSGSPLSGKFFLPMPISFNIGVEIPFAF
jgi:hypothetical protein